MDAIVAAVRAEPLLGPTSYTWDCVTDAMLSRYRTPRAALRALLAAERRYIERCVTAVEDGDTQAELEERARQIAARIEEL